MGGAKGRGKRRDAQLNASLHGTRAALEAVQVMDAKIASLGRHHNVAIDVQGLIVVALTGNWFQRRRARRLLRPLLPKALPLLDTIADAQERAKEAQGGDRDGKEPAAAGDESQADDET